MVTHSKNITLEAEALSAGESVRIHCPTCGGERPTLSITRQENGAIVWQCFRAMCEERGARNQGNFVRTKRDKPVVRFHPYTGELRAISDEERAFLLDMIGWDDDAIETARPRWAIEDRRFAFPILDPTGNRRGWVLRSWDPMEWTKALTRMDRDEPHLSYYGSHPDRPRIAVEDIPSAVRAARYTNSVALCGTGCGPDYALEIASCTNHIVWALDADATVQAVRRHVDHQLLFDTSRVQVLACDLKDMTEPALAALLENL